MQGKTINGFELKKLLGVGGMAEVWYAENRIGKKAAVKFLLPKFCDDSGIVDRFQNEAELMVALEHPNIRQVYDYSELDGRPCIVMEYLEGEDLKVMMKQGHQFTDYELVKWWNQMAQALNYTHSLHIVHRDIKPSNIFIDKHCNVRLLDFGIAKNNTGGLGTLTGSTLGTRIYMSPEQVKDPKRVDFRTDLYSLAVTFVHLLTGKAPYDSTTSSDFDIQMSIVMKPLNVSSVPDTWKGFLLPYLEKDASKRPCLRPFERVGEMRYPEKDADDATIMGKEVSANQRQTQSIGDSAQTKAEPTPLRESIAQARLNAAQERAKANSMGLSFVVNGVSFNMVKVIGSTFLMGASNGELFRSPESVKNYDADAWDDEKPVHSVTLSDYYLAETPVTQALWMAVMGNKPNSYGGWEIQYGLGDDYPAYRVSWDDIQVFLQKVSNITGKSFRLPTEAEWEYAARGGIKSRGYKFSGGDNLASLAWYANNSNGSTKPVMRKSPNLLGLYDMSGNVWEWCNDWYGNYGRIAQTNPKGPSSGSNKVLRGGSWRDLEKYCRVTSRCVYAPKGRYHGYGFRIAL